MSRGYRREVMARSKQINLNSDNLWHSIDVIADRRGISLPKLALEAGLDQSTFSHARRRRNWMSLQTLAKVLNHYQIPLSEWADWVEDGSKQ
jgi:lambda repressor-like predicted transcriptional regulator